METPILFPGAPGSRPKSRRFARSPVLFASIQLPNLTGFILNASEGGLCVQTAREIPAGDSLELRFQSIQPNTWIQTRARVAWRNETKTVAGMQFVDVTPEIVAEIRRWLAFGSSLRELRGTWWPEEASSRPPAETAAPSAEPQTKSTPQPERSIAPSIFVDRNGRSSRLSPPSEFRQAFVNMKVPRPANRRAVAAILAVLVLAALALLGSRLGLGGRVSRVFATRQPAPVQSLAAAEVDVPTAASEPTPASAPLSPPASSPKPAQPLGPTTPPPSRAQDSGLLLQAAAMTDAANANSLADSLRAKKFPAFVSKKEADRFYRVLIGPYPNETALRDARTALAATGLQTIEKHGTR
jgi:cell division septation protein DedD